MTDAPPPAGGTDPVTAIEYFRIVWKRRRILVATIVLAVGATLVYTLLAPEVFESTTTIVTPQEGSMGSLRSTLMATALLSGVPHLASSTLTPNRDLFLAILGSETMARDVVEAFGLRERYGVEHVSEAADILAGLTLISLTDSGTISIRVSETDPELAARIANFYVENLDRRLKRFDTTAASKQRSFIEGRLEGTKVDLARAEDALKKFQEEHKAFALQEQARGLVEEVAKLKGQIIAEEVVLEGMRTTASDSNPEVLRMKRRIDVMKRQLEKQFGEALDLPAGKEADATALLPFKEFPELGLELARLTREVKVHSTVYTLLTQQLEEAKISEARDMPKVQVIDVALPADLKSHPKIRLSLMIAACLSLIGGIFLCFVLEYVDTLKARLSQEKQARTPPAPLPEQPVPELPREEIDVPVAGIPAPVPAGAEPAVDPGRQRQRRGAGTRRRRRSSKKAKVEAN